MSDTNKALEGIQDYLGNGGLFNPEHMEHQKVSELILLCREALTSSSTHAERLAEALEHYIAIVPPRDTDGDEKWHKARQALTLYRAENPKV